MARMADVWMDMYKENFYLSRSDLKVCLSSYFNIDPWNLGSLVIYVSFFRVKTTATYRVDTNLGQTSSVGASSGSWITRRHTNSFTLETDSDTAV